MVYESFSVNKNSSAKLKTGGSINEQLHLFAKDEKRALFLSIGSCSDKTEKGTLFYQFCCHSKRLARLLNFKI